MRWLGFILLALPTLAVIAWSQLSLFGARMLLTDFYVDESKMMEYDDEAGSPGDARPWEVVRKVGRAASRSIDQIGRFVVLPLILTNLAWLAFGFAQTAHAGPPLPRRPAGSPPFEQGPDGSRPAGIAGDRP